MKSVALLVLAVAFVACSGGRGPRDVGNRNPRSEFVGGVEAASSADGGADSGHVIATPTAAGRKPTVLAHASARAIATSPTHVIFGDAEDDTLYSVAKAGGEPKRFVRRAPMPGALAVDGGTLAWIATPGDAIFKVSVNGGTPMLLRDRGIFTDVIAGNGDVFYTEAAGRGGSLTRISGPTAARIATFEGSPRGLALDAQRVYVATATKLVAVPRLRNEPRELAAGVGFASPHVDDTHVYATATVDGTHCIVRVSKNGGSLEVVVKDVRPAPIALHAGALVWFDQKRPALLARTIANGATRTLSEDTTLNEAVALVVDDDGAFVATGDGADAMVLAVALQ